MSRKTIDKNKEWFTATLANKRYESDFYEVRYNIYLIAKTKLIVDKLEDNFGRRIDGYLQKSHNESSMSVIIEFCWLSALTSTSTSPSSPSPSPSSPVFLSPTLPSPTSPPPHLPLSHLPLPYLPHVALPILPLPYLPLRRKNESGAA